MAQKNKVKELVGRGLNSYHTKALQQIDRIEKKNKEQNHKISILSNELDNDYLTKTEEGSVVSLEHSKEGMVYLDELQGNTMVNYCTDGSKELTLNGDIDVEGTFVTTTEGVDNGKVDVICEGNTLVNLIQGVKATSNNVWITVNDKVTFENPTGAGHVEFKIMLKPSTKYTVITRILQNSLTRVRWDLFPDNFEEFPVINNKTGVITHIFTTPSDITSLGSFRYYYPTNETGKVVFEMPIILEGDWTNKEIPQHFTGMKSVGECEDNKIEILSRNKNHVLSKPKTIAQDIVSHDIYLEPNKEYSISSNVPYDSGLCMISKNHSHTNPIFTFQDWSETVNKFTTPNNLEKGIYSLVFWKSQLSADDNSWTQVELGKTITNYIPYNSNKKEILMNEPLRGLPNGVKDKFVKINNKFYIERNCGEVTIAEDVLTTKSWGDDGNKRYVYVSDALPNMKTYSYIYTDKIPTANDFYNSNYFGVSSTSVLIFCFPTEIQTREEKKELVKPYLQNGGLKVVYELETPIYEPLEIEPTLNTYNDITHISNNSIIPCNMKIKNSGYNAIIKPSTLYTVALDTNKSGTIGINLGGAKVTTTNNVATITTPATLTDDSLRLYGKGIKGSKVRLLEGDKTNWIPSFFEGMKSSFEDKLQDDGTYKMEILSNNKNLFDINANNNKSNGVKLEIDNNSLTLSNNDAQYTWQQCNIFIKGLQRNKTYTLSVGEVNIQNDFQDKSMFAISVYEETRNIQLSSRFDFDKKECTFTVPQGANLNKISLRIHLTSHTPLINRIFVKDIQISEVKSEHIKRKSNKIQFSSIEPLRSLPSGVKDKFIFKNGKLMIERNTSKTKITSDMNFARSYEGWANIVFACEVDGLIPIDISTKNVYCNILPSFNIAELCNALGKTGIASHGWVNNKFLQIAIKDIDTVDKLREWISKRDMEIVYQIEPKYEEIPFELQKIILEGYENGTLFIDTNIPPTSTIRYAGETPIVKATKLNKTEVLSNTEDINDNIIPYLMDMDYRVVMLQLATEELEGGVSMARLFGGTYEMIKRDILSKRYSIDEYRHRLDAYLDANKITEEEYNKLGDMLNE